MKPVMNHILDIRGMIIPVTFLKITQIFREMGSGETMEIIGSDPETRQDLFKILKGDSYELLNIDNERTQYRIQLRKGPISTGERKAGQKSSIKLPQYI